MSGQHCHKCSLCWFKTFWYQNFLSENSKDFNEILSREKPDKTFYLGLDLIPKEDPRFHPAGFHSHKKLQVENNVTFEGSLYSPQINNISLKLPPVPLLLQEDEIDPSLFCDHHDLGKAPNCTKKWCHCLHILCADVGDIVELFFIDEGVAFDVSHNMHLHGHGFYVLGMERFAKVPTHFGTQRGFGNSVNVMKIKQLNEGGRIKRNLDSPPFKDTISVPDGGYTLARFKAMPGYWLLHCHMSWHSHLGMAVILKVENGDVVNPNEGHWL